MDLVYIVGKQGKTKRLPFDSNDMYLTTVAANHSCEAKWLRVNAQSCARRLTFADSPDAFALGNRNRY